MHEPLFCVLAGFLAPLDIGTTPLSLLWMFPLLASIAVVYKTTRMRILFFKTLLAESLILFLTLSGFMILAGIVLNLVVWLAVS
ncbi:MAG TPA: hypothetical protein PLQ45_00660 [Anaerohalosphaeraceae bacterium]|jgi:hypothetical protein|nr:hypothetical protein [Anaerohalosphaeraceae bacterium]